MFSLGTYVRRLKALIIVLLLTRLDYELLNVSARTCLFDIAKVVELIFVSDSVMSMLPWPSLGSCFSQGGNIGEPSVLPLLF